MIKGFFAKNILLLGLAAVIVLIGGAYFGKKSTIQVSHTQFQGTVAFIRNDNLWININGQEKQITSDAIHTKIPYETGLPGLWYSNPQISSNGKFVAFLRGEGNNTHNMSLFIIGADGNNMKKLTDNVDWGEYKLDWASDSSKIFYTYNPAGHIGMIGDATQIHSIIASTGKDETLGSYVVSSGGCGGGTSDISAHVAEDEGLGGSEQPPILQISPHEDYIIHTINCFGYGIGLLDLKTKQDRILNDKATKGVISPSGSMIAAITNRTNNIAILDPKTGQTLKSFNSPDAPMSLIWTHDEKELYYSTSKTVKQLGANDLGGNIFSVQNSSIYKISLDTGNETKIISIDAFALRLVGFSKDNSKIVVASVENEINLYNYMIKNKTQTDIVKYYPNVNLMEVNLSTGTQQVVFNKTLQSSYLSN